MTFNLRLDVPEDGANAWPHRRDALADVVRRHAPDILGTQEGTRAMLADLDARLPALRRVGGGEAARWPGEEINAIYVDPARVAVRDWGEFALSNSPTSLGSKSWGAWHARTALWAVVEWRETRAARLVVNTHFDHASWRARVRSAALLERVARGAILLGDFNARPRVSLAYRRLIRGRVDPLAGAGGTIHGWSEFFGPRIDWILLPRDLAVRSAYVVRDRPFGRYPSDHDPVVVDIVPPEQTTLPAILPPSAPVRSVLEPPAPGRFRWMSSRRESSSPRRSSSC